jgi:hypothetical protein
MFIGGQMTIKEKVLCFLFLRHDTKLVEMAHLKNECGGTSPCNILSALIGDGLITCKTGEEFLTWSITPEGEKCLFAGF